MLLLDEDKVASAIALRPMTVSPSDATNMIKSGSEPAPSARSESGRYTKRSISAPRIAAAIAPPRSEIQNGVPNWLPIHTAT